MKLGNEYLYLNEKETITLETIVSILRLFLQAYKKSIKEFRNIEDIHSIVLLYSKNSMNLNKIYYTFQFQNSAYEQFQLSHFSPKRKK